MIYFFGIFGFVAGFYAGLIILKYKLRDKSNEELRNNRKLWWAYGWIVWLMAGLGIWIGLKSYQIFIL